MRKKMMRNEKNKEREKRRMIFFSFSFIFVLKIVACVARMESRGIPKAVLRPSPATSEVFRRSLKAKTSDSEREGISRNKCLTISYF